MDSLFSGFHSNSSSANEFISIPQSSNANANASASASASSSSKPSNSHLSFDSIALNSNKRTRSDDDMSEDELEISMSSFSNTRRSDKYLNRSGVTDMDVDSSDDEEENDKSSKKRKGASGDEDKDNNANIDAFDSSSSLTMSQSIVDNLPMKTDAMMNILKDVEKSYPTQITDDEVSEVINKADIEINGDPSKAALTGKNGANESDLLTHHNVVVVDDADLSLNANANDSTTDTPATKPPAKIYKFKLDTFQRQAISFLEKNESVLVSAHTSAGKTAVAEYAIAMSLREKQRVIYTSPIKALSNQKYRNLAEEFVDVGLMTGDVTINPNASCLVMTTEILRSMLYRGSEILREVAWVIFDEVHAMNDRERGVVWEESIVLLPHKVRYVFLSATIPNGKEFTKWISKLHKQPCHIVYTDYRPTPLQHYVFPLGGEGLFLVVDEKSKFHEDNFENAMASLADDATSTLAEQVNEGSANSKAAKQQRAAKKQGKLGDLLRIVKMIMERRYDPVIIFSFSKKDCETYAVQVSKADLTNDDEKALIEKIYTNAIDSLSNDDKSLPQVTSLLPLLQKGIGIHHGGLLPILKEVVEILFGEGLIKCLFATETFAMGVNMPAKTVVFTSCRKYDGNDIRWVGPGEYIQMSGRAGRRGLDDRGIVIQMVDEKMDIEVAKHMMSGQADPLSSTFHLGYNMVLNLMRVEDVDPEFMVRHSFFMFQKEEALPVLTKKLENIRQQKDSIKFENRFESDIVMYHDIGIQSARFKQSLSTMYSRKTIAARYLNKGRVVYICGNHLKSPAGIPVVDKQRSVTPTWLGFNFGWGIVVNLNKGTKPINLCAMDQIESAKNGTEFESVDILLFCFKDSPNGFPIPSPSSPGSVNDSEVELRIVTCTLQCVQLLSAVVLSLQKDIYNPEPRRQLGNTFREIHRRFPNGPPLLDFATDIGLPATEIQNLALRVSSIKRQLDTNKVTNELKMDKRKEMYTRFLARLKLGDISRDIEKDIRKTQDVPLKNTLKRMKTVLRRLGHVDKENVIQLKGRVACEISTADELLTTELLLGGAFNDLTPELCAALASCLVFDEKGEDSIPLKQEFQKPFELLQTMAKKIAETQKECKLPIDVDEYVKLYRSDLMEVVYLWCKGSKFSQICEITEAYEGSIIRSIRRLVELLRQLSGSCKVIGDPTLENKFSEAIKLMQRDVIFSASLYL